MFTKCLNAMEITKTTIGAINDGFSCMQKHLSSYCCGGVVAICHSTSPQNCQIFIHDNVIYFCLLHDLEVNEKFESIFIISYCV